MIFQLIVSIFFCQILSGGLTRYNNANDVVVTKKIFSCFRKYNLTWMEFICPNEFLFNKIDIDDLTPTELESIESLTIRGMYYSRGSLRTIPSNICRFIKLKNLYLNSNKIQNIDFNFTTSCLSQLRTLDLSNNFITNISIKWINQMPLLENIYLQSNKLIDLPYEMFNNVSKIRILNISRNDLSTIELWTIQIREKVDYRSNKIYGFFNQYNVDLSHLQTRELPIFYTDKNIKIQFDDTIFEMYNRCDEVHSTPILTRAVLSIIKNADYLQCSCDKYYFYRTVFRIEGYLINNQSFENWICPDYSIPFIQKCNNQSSANFSQVIPRLCKIDDSESGNIPVYTPHRRPIPVVSTTTITTTTVNIPTMPDKIEKYLENITVLNNYTIENFISFINMINNRQNITNVLEETRKTYRKMIYHIENLIESINSTLNNSEAAVALVSTTKNNPVYQFNQIIQSNSSLIYSSVPEDDDSVASISIDEKHINDLSDNDFYSFFFLPSSLFHYAQIDSRIEIISPIVGAHLPIDQSLNIQMSFRDNNSHHSSGRYSCVFWQNDQWNNTGCIYSKNTTTNRHYCHCNHLTSFALIFTPNGILSQTFLPTIITSFLSMIGLSISIILSVYQQTKSSTIHRSRRFSITNIFSLSSTLILFILFTTLLIINYRTSSSSTSISCQSSKLNLVLATYFFIILTFVSKTLVGIYYYFTIFIQIKFSLFNNQPDKCYLLSLFIIILIALIPTIVASILSHQQTNVIISKNNICWFDGIYLINFITIPVSILIGINLIIMILISIRLFQFLCKISVNINQTKENRLMIATCMWIASCVLLGILWIVGPLLNLFVNEDDQSISMSSKVMQWIFALLAGLEGVWVLIVNILFYVRQQSNPQSRSVYSHNGKRKWYRIDDLRRISVHTNDKQNQFIRNFTT